MFGAKRHRTGLGGLCGWLGLLLLGILLVVPGCGTGGGDSGGGVSNGTISGTVFGIAGGVAGRIPLSGVLVTATRVQGGTTLVRSAYSDSSGGYTLYNVPTGTWDLQYQLQGFTGGTTGTNTSIRTFVGSGSLASVSDIVLTQTTSAGSANVSLYLVDGATGYPVTGATVTVGGFPATSSYSGRYDFLVPVSGTGAALSILVYHPGFGSVVPVPSTVSPIPGVPITMTVALQPSQSFVAGTLQVSAFHSLYTASGALGTMSITSPQISSSFLSPLVDSQTGAFNVRVPSSTLGGSQYFDLVFTSPYFQQVTVSNILAPTTGGTSNLSGSVYLQPQYSTLVGNVVTSQGLTTTGYPNEVVVAETGQAATLVNGSYTLSGVPSGISLTLRATTLTASTGVQTGTAVVTPLPGTFNVAPIYTY